MPYVWGFVGGAPRVNGWRTAQQVPPRTPESDALSRDLQGRGFKFVGSTICYAFMQAVGLVNDHTIDCFRYRGLDGSRRGLLARWPRTIRPCRWRTCEPSFHAIASDVQSVFGRLDEAQLNWRPDAARWSVAQCFDHLLNANREMFQALDAATDAGFCRGRCGNGPQSSLACSGGC